RAIWSSRSIAQKLSFAARWRATRDLPDPIYPHRKIFILITSGLDIYLKHLQIYINFLLKNKLMIVYLHPHLRNNARPDLVAQLVEHLPFKERVLGSSPSQITNKSSDFVGREVYPECSVAKSREAPARSLIKVQILLGGKFRSPNLEIGIIVSDKCSFKSIW